MRLFVYSIVYFPEIIKSSSKLDSVPYSNTFRESR